MRTAQLGDFVRISGGGTPSRNRPEFFNGSIPWVTVKDLGGEFFLRGAQEHISQAGLDGSASRLIPPGNVLLVTRMAVGRAVINTVEVAINQDLKVLVCDPRLHPKYLLFFLTYKAPELAAKATGATVKGITIDEIESLNIPIPDLSEQKRIAGLLEQADRLRRTRRYALELSDTFLPAVFLELFGRANPDAANWPQVGLTELCEREDDIRCGPFGTQLNKSEFRRSGVPLWGIKHINTGFELETDEFLTQAKSQELDAYSLLPGDLVMTRKGTIGNCALYPLRFQRGIMHSDLLRIRLRAGAVSPIFLNHQLHFGVDVKRQIDLISGGAIMAGINVGMLKSIRVQLPPSELQQHFSSLVAKHERLRAGQREALCQADHLFQSLLNRAFAI